MSFANVFRFGRPTVSNYRGPGGGRVQADVDVPRFDHDAGGAPIGLLVDLGSEMGQHDAVALAEAVVPAGPATVLHETAGDDSVIVRRAHYTLDANITIDACLRQAGHHRSVGAVAGFVKIRDGVVPYRGKRWAPPAVIVLADGRAIGIDAATALLTG